jgi:hypothetical protein
MYFSTPIFTALFFTKLYKNTPYCGKSIIDQTKRKEEILLLLKKHKEQQYTYDDLMHAVKEDSFTIMMGIMTALQRKDQVQVEIKNGIKYFSYKERKS